MTPQEENIYVFAARYAHDRKTGAALMVCKAIKKNWNEFSGRIKEQLKEEAKDFATCNFDDWQMILDLD